MKRIYGAVAVLLLAVGFFPVPAHALVSTNNFYISSYDIQYELSQDSESRSVLKTTETIVAQFPTYDQNHGIERAIPANYDGHPTDLHIIKVTDGNGGELQYSTRSSNDTTVLRIGNADEYVHGTQTYTIEYSQHDVTKYFSDTERDEWYWDTNGTEWKVPISALKVSVKLDSALRDALQGTPSCYQGLESSTTPCTLLNNDETGYEVEAFNMAAGENITIGFGFPKNTFGEYKMSAAQMFAVVWAVIQGISVLVALGLITIFSILYYRRTYRIKEQDPIAAEYIPPKDTSVLVSAQVITNATSAFSAQLIDLAVRHFISIVETKAKSLWIPAKYDIVIQSDVTSLHDEEKEILSDMFGHLPKQGERLALKKLQNDMAYSVRTLDNDKKLKVLLSTVYGIRAKSPNDSKLFYKWAVIILVVAVLTLSIALGLSALIIWIFGLVIRPLSDKGLALRRYVLGLDKYIKASETERLAFLQGPETAQKVGYDVDPNNPGQVVKLYERVLPYAILFGREKEWSKRLGDIYQQSQTAPDWYVGTTAFNAAVFATTMQSFSQATVYSSGSSSSSGGSSGGGFSGGGGGGGGGGGW